VPLGGKTHSTPVIAGGRIYVGTSHAEPRDPRRSGDRGVLLCLDEKTGALRWQLVCPKLTEDRYFDWPEEGMSSSATVAGDRVYLVTNRTDVVCLDVHGLANGNDGPVQDEAVRAVPPGSPEVPLGPLDADIIWAFSLKEQAGIWPHDGAHSSIMIRGEQLWLNTGTGVDNTHRVIRTPDAPSLVVLDKATGRWLARDAEKIAPTIFHASWSSPSSGRVGEQEIITFCGGNGMVYGFAPLATAALPAVGAGPATLQRLFTYDPDPTGPKSDVHRFTTNKQEGPSNILGMATWHEGRVYVAGGGDLFWGKNTAWLQCFVPAVGPDGGSLPESARQWSAPLRRHTTCTPAVHQGLVYATDTMGTLHCLDAATGASVWTHECQGDFWASCLIADGRVYAGTRRGHFYILATGREKKELAHLDLGSPISATATAAHGVLYVATMAKLWAFKSGAASPPAP
jgi:outer membrane protein assembly factor BamB